MFFLCERDKNEGYERLGAALVQSQSDSDLFRECYGLLAKYSTKEQYCWPVLLLVNHMADHMDDAEELIRTYLPIMDRFIEKGNSEYVVERGVTAVYLLHKVPNAAESIIRMKNFDLFVN